MAIYTETGSASLGLDISDFKVRVSFTDKEDVSEVFEDVYFNKTESVAEIQNYLNITQGLVGTANDILNEVTEIKADVDNTRDVTIPALNTLVANTTASFNTIKNEVIANAEVFKTYQTLAAANADLANIANSRAITVYNDTTNNGFYIKESGVLVKKSNSTFATINAALADRAALVKTGIDAATEITSLQPTDEFIFGRSGLGLGRISYENLSRILAEGSMGFETTYTSYPTVTVTATPNPVLPGDADRRGMLVQCFDADLAINTAGGNASFTDGKSFILLASSGGAALDDYTGTGTVSMVARAPGGVTTLPGFSVTPFITVKRTSAGLGPTQLAGDRAMAPWTDPVDIRFRNAVRTAINNIATLANYDELQMLYIGGASANNNLVNLAGPSKPRFTPHGSLVTVPYLGDKGNGTDSYIETNLTMDAMGMTPNNHCFSVYPGTTTVDTGTMLGVSSAFFVQPNRTSTVAGFRTGGGTDLPTVAAGKWVGLSRFADATAYDQYVEATRTPVTRAAAATNSSFTLKILAISGTSSAVSFSNGTVRAAFAGVSISPDNYTVIYNQLKEVMNVADLIRSEV